MDLSFGLGRHHSAKQYSELITAFEPRKGTVQYPYLDGWVPIFDPGNYLSISGMNSPYCMANLHVMLAHHPKDSPITNKISQQLMSSYFGRTFWRKLKDMTAMAIITHLIEKPWEVIADMGFPIPAERPPTIPRPTHNGMNEPVGVKVPEFYQIYGPRTA